MTSTAVSADFHSTFQADKRATPPSLTDITTRLHALRAGLNENLAFLPAYDRRSCELQQLKELESKLSQLRSKDKPKSRFAFSAGKSKAAPVKAEGEAPTPGSSASAPSAPTPKQSTLPVSANAATAAGPVHVISNLSSQLVRAPSDVEGGYTITLESLSSCIIDLRPPPQTSGTSGRNATPPSTAQATSIHAKSLRRCVLLVPVMEGSAIMEGLEDCLVILGAQQFRIHSSRSTTILLHVPSTPIIEHCSALAFGPYPLFLQQPEYTSKHHDVQDFDWVREGKSPNWAVLDPSNEAFAERDAEAISGLGDGDGDAS
ncbi:putative tubulin folding cofactor C [Dioszegia hungarica]|uniref:Tubulin folding cofactor C n=1 Tax=Dioszegia hungarica TaxID=4972 RepID=A0AA38HDU6_9TREE|nr:putative tubulin folding cofactor C [Dioszegia hungarica]KAI9637031.1 putative tubulin folding cofactor C [Dioszegia hungarica]